MPEPGHPRPRRRRLARAAIAVAGLALFIGASSLLQPRLSTARNDADLDRRPDHISEPAPRRSPDGGRLIGQTRTATHRLYVYATPAGPRYTVTDADGDDLARGLRHAELAKRFPDLDPDELHAGAAVVDPAGQ